jgi:hypothetical protein
MLIIDEKIIELDDLADQVVAAFMSLAVVTDFKARKLAFESDAELQQKLQTLEENRAYIVLCNQNPFFKVFKVPETKGISLNDFDEIIGSFQFGVGIRQFHGV